jgi:hypothetical protein
MYFLYCSIMPKKPRMTVTLVGGRNSKMAATKRVHSDWAERDFARSAKTAETSDTIHG